MDVGVRNHARKLLHRLEHDWSTSEHGQRCWTLPSALVPLLYEELQHRVNQCSQRWGCGWKNVSEVDLAFCGWNFISWVSFSEISLFCSSKIRMSAYYLAYVLLNFFCWKISWQARTTNDIGNQALVTIDGTDMPVQMGFSKKFFSHKFKSSGVRYEIGMCIQTGHIVWINGPFRCGLPDIEVARQGVIGALDMN